MLVFIASWLCLLLLQCSLLSLGGKVKDEHISLLINAGLLVSDFASGEFVVLFQFVEILFFDYVTILLWYIIKTRITSYIMSAIWTGILEGTSVNGYVSSHENAFCLFILVFSSIHIVWVWGFLLTFHHMVNMQFYFLLVFPPLFFLLLSCIKHV